MKTIFLEYLLLNFLLCVGVTASAEPFSASPAPAPSSASLAVPEETLPSPAASPAFPQVLTEKPSNGKAETNAAAAGDESATDEIHEGNLPSMPPGPATAADPNALIPGAETRPSPPHLTDAQKQEINTKELVKYKAIKVRAEQDPVIQRMLNRAQRTSTEEDYRAAMREYYRMLFNKIELLDSSLSLRARGMKEAYLRRLAQTKIEPTIPLHPPPTPEPLSPQ